MTTYVVSSAAQLMTAAAKAKGGDSITLTGSAYSAVSLANLHPSSMVTISSQNSAHPVFISGLNVNTCSNFKFNYVGIDGSAAVPNQYGGSDTWLVNVNHSSAITFSGVTAHGLTGVTLTNAVSAINIENSTGVTVQQSSFQYLHNAVSVYQSTGFIGANNSFSHIFDDGIHGGGTSNVTITGNTFTDFHEDPSDTDHPDTIQFFTLGQTASASNFYITNNTYTRGDGNPVQGIFMRDEVGNLPFHYVTISGNSYTGAIYSGIRVIDGTSVNVSHNTLTSYTDYWSGIVLQTVVNASVIDNSSEKYSYIDVTGLQASGNVTTAEVPVPIGAQSNAVGADTLAGLTGASSNGPFTTSGNPLLFHPLIAAAVPEPATWIAFVLGVSIGGSVLRRRRRAALATA